MTARISTLLVLGALLLNCGCDDEVQKIREAGNPLVPGITIGQVFDNYRHCQEQGSWQSVKVQGVTQAHFSCPLDNWSVASMYSKDNVYVSSFSEFLNDREFKVELGADLELHDGKAVCTDLYLVYHHTNYSLGVDNNLPGMAAGELLNIREPRGDLLYDLNYYNARYLFSTLNLKRLIALYHPNRYPFSAEIPLLIARVTGKDYDDAEHKVILDVEIDVLSSSSRDMNEFLKSQKRRVVIEEIMSPGQLPPSKIIKKFNYKAYFRPNGNIKAWSYYTFNNVADNTPNALSFFTRDLSVSRFLFEPTAFLGNPLPDEILNLIEVRRQRAAAKAKAETAP